ncbi:MAG: hypothetical protein ACYC2K_17780 [Gemmatimonadales bacterium]
MDNFRTEDLRLLVPDLWSKPWDEWAAEAEGVDRDFISAAAHSARALKRIRSEAPTPERLAWLALWSRLFGALSGAQGTVDRKSRFATGVMSRVASETALHVHAIALPALEAKPLTDESWASVRESLRAYLAWSLHGDERLCRRLLDDAYLAHVYDPKPEQEMIRRLGPALESWEKLSGSKIDIISDNEATFDRERAAERLRTKLHRIDRWSSDERIAPWYSKVSELAGHKDRAVSLFELLGLGKNVFEFLHRRDLSFAYVSYIQGSGHVHGSSLDAAMVTADGLVMPDFASIAGDLEASAQTIVRDCRLSMILLELVARHLDSDTPAV